MPFKRLLGLILLVATFVAAPFQPARGNMPETTTIPRPEYPRPDFRRDNWLNLNGTWGFRIDPDNVGENQAWYAPASAEIRGQIVVPFPWQSKLSGVENLLHRGVAWYRRAIQVPADWAGQRVVLHFGAVDYFAKVWVNGSLIGEHEGGYTPFEYDITEALRAEDNIFVVRVDDPADLREIPHGKQRSLPPNPWDDVSFTTTSGIWQTVWLEARPAAYIQSAHITPDVPGKKAIFAVSLAGPLPDQGKLDVTLRAPDGTTITASAPASAAEVRFEVPIPSPILWDVGAPNLYDVTLRLQGADTVYTYFGMRSIATQSKQVLLNGRPIYLMTALDQGYWPDGLFTAPTDEALRADVAYALRLGLNGLREHIKIEDPRFAYWADKLGLLLWCDTPSPVLFTELARARLMRDLHGMIERDFNHPSIVIWSPYNESWGLEFRSNREIQDYLLMLYDQIKQWDATRLVVDNSGWRHVRTDIADSHKYTDDPVEWRGVLNLLENDPMSLEVLQHPFFAGQYKYNGEPLMMSEYASGWRDDRSWSFKWQTDELRRHAGIVGYTYTELYDIEHEYAGFALYDRTPKDFGFDPAMINSPDLIVLDYRQSALLHPGDSLEVALYLSAYGLPPLTAGKVNWRLEAVTPEPGEPLATGSFDIAPAPFTVTQLSSITLKIPNIAGPVKLWAEALDSAGQVRTRNYRDFEIVGDSLPVQEQQKVGSLTRYLFRLPLNSYSGGAFSPLGPTYPARLEGSDLRPELAGRDTGYVEFQAPLPGENGAWQELTIGAEIGSMPPEVLQALEGKGYPSDVTVSVNGVELSTWAVSDRPVNALGALTRLNKLGVGEHGFWMTATASPDELGQIEAKARTAGKLVVRFEVKTDAAHRGGLTLFGVHAGQYGRDPVITLTVGQ